MAKMVDLSEWFTVGGAARAVKKDVAVLSRLVSAGAFPVLKSGCGKVKLIDIAAVRVWAKGAKRGRPPGDDDE
jgi:hypothetical protein